MNAENLMRKHICEIGQKLWQAGYTPSNSGNICVRISDNEFLATPTGIQKGMLTPDMLLKLRYEPEKPEEERITVLQCTDPYKLTSEIRIHLVALAEFPQLNATIHSHAPYTQLFSMLGVKAIRLPDNFAGARNIPIVPWVKPGTWDIAYGNVEALKSCPKDKFVVMGLHGLLTVGRDLEDAFLIQEKIESSAQAAYLYQTYTRIVGDDAFVLNAPPAEAKADDGVL